MAAHGKQITYAAGHYIHKLAKGKYTQQVGSAFKLLAKQPHQPFREDQHKAHNWQGEEHHQFL